MANNNCQISFWKWVSGTLVLLMVSNTCVAFAFKTTDEQIVNTVKTNFTDISKDRGMYVLDGQPRISRLEMGYEKNFEKLMQELICVKMKVTELEIKLDKVIKDQP